MNYFRTSVVITITLLLFCLGGCSNPEKEKEAHYEKALEYINKGDNKAAIIELRNAIGLDGKLAKAHYQLGLLYLEEEDPAKAFKSFHRAVSLNPDNLDAGIRLAEFYLISRKKDESRKYAEQVLAKKPDHHDGLVLLANLELIDGNFDKAEEIVDKALASHTNSSKLYNTKGRIYSARNQPDLAEEGLTKAIEFGPDNYANYQTLLLFYQRTKNIEKAQGLLADMIKRFPDNPQPHIILSRLHIKNKQFDLAEKELKQAIQTKPDDIQLHLLLIEFYKKQQQYQQAESYLKETITSMPDSLDLQVALANIQFQMRKYDEAKAGLEAILNENELHGGGNLLKIKFLIKDNKNRDAVTMLAPLIKDYPYWPEPYFQLGIAHLKLREFELAQQAVEQALRRAPTESRFHTLFAQILLLRGESENAGKEASVAIRLNPKNFRAAVILTKALVQEKRYKVAINVLNRMLEQRPDHPELLFNISLSHIGLEDYDNGKKMLERLMEVTPNNSTALSLLAKLSSKDDPDLGLKLIQTYLQKAPDSGGHHLLLGRYYLRKNELDPAMAAFRKAQELDPDNPQPYILIGRLLTKQGKRDKAIEEYRSLLQASPDNIDARMGLAILLETLDKIDEATGLYQEILQIKQNFAPAANNLAWLVSNSEEPDLGEALRLAMTAKKALPESPDISDTLGWVHFKRKAYNLAKTQFEYAVSIKPEAGIFLYHLALAQSMEQDNMNAIRNLEKALATSGPFKERKQAEDLLQQLKTKTQ